MQTLEMIKKEASYFAEKTGATFHQQDGVWVYSFPGEKLQWTDDLRRFVCVAEARYLAQLKQRRA